MSFREHPGAFLTAESLPLVASADELDLPPPESGKYQQRYDIAAGTRFNIWSADRMKVGYYSVRSCLKDDRFGMLVSMDNIVTQSTLHLTVSQLVFLEAHRRLRQDNGRPLNDNAPGAAFRISETRLMRSKFYLSYVQAILQASEEEGVEPKRGLIERVAKAHAIQRGDQEVPSYNTLRIKIDEYLQNPSDPLLALAPSVSSGNRRTCFGSHVEELMADAVEKACRLDKGDWRDAKMFFVASLHERKNEHMLKELCNEKGALLQPSDRTFQRRLAAIDKFQKTLWRHGAAYARRKFNLYVTQALPEHPLDVVDVDFTPIEIIVIDPERPIIYGRPHLIVFRDRKTGSILGYSVSFMGASFEHFIEGLVHAISPKDLSRYPGLEWKQYGTFRRLGVDNDMAFINESARESLAQLGIQLVEYRPGHPWEKGAVERLFQTLNQGIIHNLPRSTKGGPKEMATFAEKNPDLPMLTLSELNEFITRYICSDYHVNPHKGLGMLRTLDGIPNQLWDEGISHAHARRPLDPDVVTRMIGNTKDVTVRQGCVRWDNLIYCHPDLVVLQAEAQNRTAVPGVQSTKYKAWRNPSDLGQIYLLNHHTGQVIEVPVQEADAWYAKGLRLYQHTKVMQYLKEKNRDSRDFQSAYNDFANKLEEINRIRVNKRTRQQLAKFHAVATKKYRRTRIVEIDHDDPAGSVPLELFPTSSEQRSAQVVVPTPVTVTRPTTSPAPDSAEINQEDGRKYTLDLSQDDDDISHLLKRKDDGA